MGTQENTPEPTEQPAEGGAEPQATPEAAEGGAPQAPDLSEQITALKGDMEAIRERLVPEEPEEGDLYSQLLPQQGDEEYGEAEGAEPQGEPAAAESEEDILDEYVRERVAETNQAFEERVVGFLEGQQRQQQLTQLAEKYPDLTEPEMVDAITARLAPMAQRYGRGVFTDPDAVQATYFAVKAEKQAAGETSAAEAAGQGASIETGAGASAGSSESAEDAIKREIVAAGPGGNAFA